MRVIDTKVPNNRINSNIFHGVLGQLSDGIWENSPACTSYWFCCDIDDDGDTIKLVIDNAPVVRYFDEYLNNRYFRMSDADILHYFVRKMLEIVKIEGKDNKSEKEYLMNANNQTICEYLRYEADVRVCHVYEVRKKLMEVARCK